MIKCRLLIGASFCALAVFLLSDVFLQKEQIATPAAPIVQPTILARDDAQSRAEYEHRRLVNPKTGLIPEDIRRKELNFANEHAIRSKNSLQKTTSQVWNWRGPFNIGGRTRAFAVDVDDESVLIAGGVSGGMWRSEDSGASWTMTTDKSALHSVSSIVQDKRSGNTNVWFYGTGEISGNSARGNSGSPYRGDGIYRSVDGGMIWELIEATATNSPESWNKFDYIHRLALDTSNDEQTELYAAIVGGIYRSVDGTGEEWTEVLGDFWNSSLFSEVTVTSTGIVYASISDDGGDVSGFYRSNDGLTWVDITPEDIPAGFRRTVIAIAPSNEDVVYFMTQTPDAGAEGTSMWKFDAANSVWTNLSLNLPVDKDHSPELTLDTQGSYDMVLKVKPDDENVVIAGGVHLFRSTDGFATADSTSWIGGWQYVDDFNHHADQHDAYFLPSDPDAMYSTHDGGISFTSDILADPVVWTSLSNGYNTTQFYTVAVSPDEPGDVSIIGGMQDNGTWATNYTDSNEEWLEFLSGDGSYTAVADSSKLVYTSSQNGNIVLWNYMEEDYTWAKLDPAGGTDYEFINPFILNPMDGTMLYLPAGSELWRCSNTLDIPVHISDPAEDSYWEKLTNAAVPGEVITALDASYEADQRLYYGTNSGRMFYLESAQTGQPEKVEITAPEFPTDGYIGSISVDQQDRDRVFVTFPNYEVLSAFYTEDGGQTWSDIGGNLEENPDGSGNGPSFRWGEIVRIGDSIILYVGTSTGLYSASNLFGSLTEWTPEGESEIGNVVVSMVTHREADGVVVAGTHGGGVYSTQLVTGIEDDPIVAPSEFKLAQNYPNPFNPETTIRYTLPVNAKVTLRVFNITGQLVAELVNDQQSVGSHSVVWSGKTSRGVEAASGVYIYQIKAGAIVQSKKMILLR